MKEYTYEDPTGGGDDVTLTAPDWIDPPDHLVLFDRNVEYHRFELVED